jgi:hypothetical protein
MPNVKAPSSKEIQRPNDKKKQGRKKWRNTELNKTILGFSYAIPSSHCSTIPASPF